LQLRWQCLLAVRPGDIHQPRGQIPKICCRTTRLPGGIGMTATPARACPRGMTPLRRQSRGGVCPLARCGPRRGYDWLNSLARSTGERLSMSVDRRRQRPQPFGEVACDGSAPASEHAVQTGEPTARGGSQPGGQDTVKDIVRPAGPCPAER